VSTSRRGALASWATLVITVSMSSPSMTANQMTANQMTANQVVAAEVGRT
jgi:hypothetical protein